MAAAQWQIDFDVYIHENGTDEWQLGSDLYFDERQEAAAGGGTVPRLTLLGVG